MTPILCLKSFDIVKTSIGGDRLGKHGKKVWFLSILGRMTPRNDPSDPLVEAIRIRKQLKRIVMIPVLCLKSFRSV